MTVHSVPAERSLYARERWISLLEVLLGAFIVIGHNVLRILPNEVPVLFVLYFLSLRLRERRWTVPGLERPPSWLKTVLSAVAAAAVLQLGSELAIQPLGHFIWHGSEQASSALTTSSLGWKQAAQNLVIVWIFAAFGEELGYRGYLLRRAADLGNGSTAAYAAAMLYVAILFGFGHFYKGPAGVLDSIYSGTILGGVYLLSGRNLWACILTHGLSDTLAVGDLFMGWAT